MEKTSNNDTPSFFDEPVTPAHTQNGTEKGSVKPEKPVLPLEMIARSAKVPADDITKPKKPQNIPTSVSLEMEKGKEKPNIILLFVRGTFLRAYNGSAWLIHCLFKETYKILRDKNLGTEPFVYMGFPHDKLEEIFGDEAIVSDQTETYIKMLVPEDALKSITAYDKWLKAIPIRDKRERELPSNESMVRPGVLDATKVEEVISALARYSVERHTLLENSIFLSDIIDRLAV